MVGFCSQPGKWPDYVHRELEVSFNDIRTELVDRTEGLEGDIVECGVWRGKSLAGIALRLKEIGSGRIVHTFDSFKGLPEPSERDITTEPHRSKPNLKNNVKFIRQGRFDDVSVSYLQRKLELLRVREYVKI